MRRETEENKSVSLSNGVIPFYHRGRRLAIVVSGTSVKRGTVWQV